MKNFGIKASIYLNYFVFAILLNSVGIVILKSINNFGILEKTAGNLDAFKDLSIAITSFVIASFLSKIGYKKAMLIGLAIVTLASLTMFFGNSFDYAKLLFAMVGISFALIKVSVYSIIGFVSQNQKEHNALMSSVEGVFMFGIAIAYFLFPAFNSDTNRDSWLNVYLLLALLSGLSFVFLFFTKFENDEHIKEVNFAESFSEMLQLLLQLLIIVFLISAFLFVMIEQGIMTWLPTFNSKVLHLPENISVMMASILAVSLGIGRLLAGEISKKINWIWVLSFCIISAMLLVVFVLPQTVGLSVKPIHNLSDIPLIGFAFPLVGLFIAPIYPLLNSVILSSIPKKFQSAMTGWIVVFSAVGGTVGSKIIGYLFQYQGPERAFYYILIPMFLLLLSFFILKKLTSKK
jgi:fucose permease